MDFLLMKIIFFGEDFPDKTSLMQRFRTIGTIGVDSYAKNIFIDRQEVKLQIWDLGSIFPKSRVKLFIPQFILGALGGLYLYDVKDYSTFAHVDDWFSIIRNELKNKDNFPILLVGIIADDDKEREVTAEEAIKMTKDLKVSGFMECNLKKGENLEKALEALIRLILDNIR